MNGSQISRQVARFALPPSLGIKKMLDRFLVVLTETDTTLAEFGSSTSLLFIGLILAAPVASLDAKIPLFNLMLNVAPEAPWWALGFISLGAAQSFANLNRRIEIRRVLAFVCATAFGFLGLLGTISTAPVLILGSLFMVQSLVNALVYLRLGLPPRKVAGAG